MATRFSNPLRSEMHESSNDMYDNVPVGKQNLFMKNYPKYFKRQDVQNDFIAIQRELKAAVPYACVIKEDLDTSFARVQYDVAPADEVMLERILAKRGFVKA